MKNLKIGSKLIVSFIIVAIVASISGIVSMVVIANTNTRYSDALISYGFAQGDIGKAMVVNSENLRYAHDIVSYTTQADVDAAKKKMEENTAKYATYVEAVQKNLTTDAARTQYDKIASAFDAFKSKREEAIALGDTLDETKSKQAQRMMADEVDPLYSALYTEWAALMNLKVEVGNDMSNDLSTQGTVSLLLSLALIVIALIISLIFGTVISRGISRPITQCVSRLELLTQGDLSSPVPQISSKDETGMLANSTSKIVSTMSEIISDEGYLLGEMADGNFAVTTTKADRYVGDFSKLITYMKNIVERLSETIGQVIQSSDQVSNGADQVSSGAQALSQGATEQASSIQELSATITEISGQIKETSANAEKAKAQSERAGEAVVGSNQQMQDMILAMNDISSKSGEIGKIIKTIDDIAFQTNILALNAAVEAARAGEAGKGFAVVADEVRNLASKSADAANNTSVLIEETIRAVDNGKKMADSTAQAMLDVVDGTKAVTSLVEDIANASVEQADAVNQVTLGVEQISAVVQTNSATAEESAAASEELSGQAAILKDLVGRFKLRS